MSGGWQAGIRPSNPRVQVGEALHLRWRGLLLPNHRDRGNDHPPLGCTTASKVEHTATVSTLMQRRWRCASGSPKRYSRFDNGPDARRHAIVEDPFALRAGPPPRLAWCSEPVPRGPVPPDELASYRSTVKRDTAVSDEAPDFARVLTVRRSLPRRPSNLRAERESLTRTVFSCPVLSRKAARPTRLRLPRM